jgi:hypothetical protein
MFMVKTNECDFRTPMDPSSGRKAAYVARSRLQELCVRDKHADVVGYAAIGGLKKQARRTGGRPPSARLLCGDVDICLL